MKKKFEDLPEPRYLDTVKFYAKGIKKEIGLINFIFDSYEGIGNIRTINEEEGLLEFWISPDFIEEARAIFREFERHFNFHIRDGG